MQIQKISSDTPIFQAKINQNKIIRPILKEAGSDVFVKEKASKATMTLIGVVLSLFGVDETKPNEPDVMVELSYEEVEKMRAKIKKDPVFQNFKLYADDFCKEQVILADRILNDEKLRNDKSMTTDLADIIYEVSDKNQLRLANKILSDEKLYGNENIRKDALIILSTLSGEDETNIKCEVLNKYTSSEKFYGNENIKKNFVKMLNFTNTEERLYVVNKLFDKKALRDNKEVMDRSEDFIKNANTIERFEVINKVLDNKKLYRDDDVVKSVSLMLPNINNSRDSQIVMKILNNKDLYSHGYNLSKVANILSNITTDGHAEIVNKILDDKELYNNISLMNILPAVLPQADIPESKIIVDKILDNPRLAGSWNLLSNLSKILGFAKQYGCADSYVRILDKITNNRKLLENETLKDSLGDILLCANSHENRKIIRKVFNDEKLYENKDIVKNLPKMLPFTPREANIKLINEFLEDKKLYGNNLVAKAFPIAISYVYSSESRDVLKTILYDKQLRNNPNVMENLTGILCYTQNKRALKLVERIISDENIYNNSTVMGELTNVSDVAISDYRVNVMSKIINQIFDNKDLYENTNIIENFGEILTYASTNEKYEVVEKILNEARLYKNCKFDEIFKMLRKVETEEEADVACKLLEDDQFSLNAIADIMVRLKDPFRKQYVYDLCQNYKKMELTQQNVAFLCMPYTTATPKQLQQLNKIIGNENVSKLNDYDLDIACQISEMYGKHNINEIPAHCKKALLRALIASNIGLLDVSNAMKQMFSLVPKNAREYCSLLPALVRSMGIETKSLNPAQVKEFDKSLLGLSDSLKKLSDDEFTALKITQEYPKDEFIENVRNIVKVLPREERQKFYDYYGFELHHNRNNKTGFSITGYPANLNNGEKLAQITDPATKAAVEYLRSDVIRFSEDNPIQCNNKDIEDSLNEIFKFLPELHIAVGKTQHPTHSFDILQHSLKVMQKISQDAKFQELNDSDKKIMMLAALLHDITKLEGSVDKTHPKEGAFDTYYIAQKFGLTREEQIKLYKLTQNHEWLAYVNTSETYGRLTERLKSVAFELQNDNLLDMALIFTHADLKAVKSTDIFHDTKVGVGRMDIEGTSRSFGELADIYAEKIRGYVYELQKTQPFLPVTKFPKASRINEAITHVNPDGSTNIKGVYKDKDGLIVLKFNEVEDWELIGFPKDSSTKGVMTTGVDDKRNDINVETGNIKFFVHGLDFEDQLRKFDAFSMPDSEAMLSLSYAERPESKYRFFRAQGVILDFDTKYIHGGGDSDAGSGCKKTIDDFKRQYASAGIIGYSRNYVSDMLKKATGLNDDEYIKFISENRNKPFAEIKPVEIRDKVIKELATMNSNRRKGNREYNEMYGSNPERVMGVFVYKMKLGEKTDNPIEYLHSNVPEGDGTRFGTAKPISTNQRTGFLRKYACEHDIPLVFLGN